MNTFIELEESNQPIRIITPSTDQWEQYKALRLRALQQDPQAFGSSYEEELSYPEEKWKSYLNNPDSEIICAQAPNGELIGLMVASFNTKLKSKHIADIYSVFIDINHRGKGISKLMFANLLESIKQRNIIRKVKLTVNADQTAAIALYERFGFVRIGLFKDELSDGNGNFYDEIAMELYL
jgi:ribosomal protein S18 acetylase RimI-like enzyme